MHEYGGDIHFVCLEAQALTKKQFSFVVFLFTCPIKPYTCLETTAFILDI